MTVVYRPGWPLTVIFTVCGLSGSVALVVSVISVLTNGRTSSAADWAAEAPVALIFVGLSGLLAWMVLRGATARLTLSDDALEARQVFSTRVIRRCNVGSADVLKSGGFTPSASVRVSLADGTAERIQIPGRYITNAGAAKLASAIEEWALTA